MTSLSSALTELTVEILKAASRAFEKQYLSVRMKTQPALHSELDKLDCHFRVTSSSTVPVVGLLREKKLLVLTRFLLQVQSDNEDWCCVLVNKLSSDILSCLSLKLTRQQADEACTELSSVDSKGDNYRKDTSRFDSRQISQCAENDKSGNEPSQTDHIVVECTDLEAKTLGVQNDKQGTSLHIKFTIDRIVLLKEGRLMHDFLRQLKLFHPQMEISFLLNIDGQISQAKFRCQDFQTIQGLAFITDPSYFTQALAASVNWQQFGMVLERCISDQAEGRDAACLLVENRSVLPAWVDSNNFALILTWRCSSRAPAPVEDSVNVQRLLHDMDPTDLAKTATDALEQLYLTSYSAPCHQQQTHGPSKLDILLPFISQSVAEIYSRSQDLHFRLTMEHLTQANCGRHIESFLHEGLKTFLSPSAFNSARTMANTECRPSEDYHGHNLPFVTSQASSAFNSAGTAANTECRPSEDYHGHNLPLVISQASSAYSTVPSLITKSRDKFFAGMPVSGTVLTSDCKDDDDDALEREEANFTPVHVANINKVIHGSEEQEVTLLEEEMWFSQMAEELKTDGGEINEY